MNNQKKIHQAILTLQNRQSDPMKTPCPDPAQLSDLLETAPYSVVVHVAFCKSCQQKLQVINTGKVFVQHPVKPDLSKILRRLRRHAHWSNLKQHISNVLNTPHTLFPQPAFSTVRSGNDETMATNLTVFEINLSPVTNLSRQGLSIAFIPPQNQDTTYQLQIDGFVAELANVDVCLGISGRKSFLKACNYRTGTQDWDLSQIEQRLQRGFRRAGKLTRRLEKLLQETIWIDGILSGNTKTGESVAMLNLSEEQMALLNRTDIWAMLLIGDRNSKGELND